MTEGRGRAGFEPGKEICDRYAISYRWDPEKLKDVVRKFGPLPEDGQKKLIERLVVSFGEFQFRGPNVRTTSANVMAKRIQGVAANARKLLSAFGMNVNGADVDVSLGFFEDRSAGQRLQYLRKRLLSEKEKVEGVGPDGEEVSLFLSLAGVDTGRRDDRAGLEANEAHERVAEAVLAVVWLHRQAEVASRQIESNRKKGRGGAESSQTATGFLIRDAIEIRVEIGQEYPDPDGKTKVGLGGPLRGFVRSVASLFGTEVTDRQIDNSWRERLRRNQTRK